MQKIKKQGSLKARHRAARLVASQAVYQMLLEDKDAKEIVKEFLEHRLNQNVDGFDLVTAEPEFLSKLVQGVDERYEDLISLIIAQLPTPERIKTLDILLRSIMLLGTYELLENQETDAPIILNDYMDVAVSFYDKKEASIVNAVLDKIAKTVRS